MSEAKKASKTNKSYDVMLFAECTGADPVDAVVDFVGSVNDTGLNNMLYVVTDLETDQTHWVRQGQLVADPTSDTTTEKAPSD